MTVVGLHPEELFDKLVDGELTPAERERLRQHLEGCDVCRFEYAARLDFQAETLENATTTPPLALPLRPPLLAPEEPTPAPAPPRRRRTLVWGLAAALLISASGAVASGVSGRVPWHTLGALFSQKSAPVAPAAAPKKPPIAAPVTVEAPATEAAPAEAPVVAALPPAEAPLAAPHHTPVAVRAHAELAAVAPTAVAALPAHAEMPPTQDATKDSAKEPSGAAQLFGEANQARRSGDIGRASGLYHLLQEQFPGSPEADLSRVTLALLLLDSGDAQGALSGFERYLAAGSRALEAEALVGRARALGRLGRRDQEASAWREVQRKYPRSIYGRQASERLAALGQP